MKPHELADVTKLPADARRVGSSELLERALMPMVGDKYTRADGYATLEITRVTLAVVTCEMVDEDGCQSYAWLLPEFRELAEKTLNHGARFEPARSNEKSSHGAGRKDNDAK